ncbi:hypothetical protein [Bacillus swezeyi]|uniref:Uncharacterized protein n=1 Tax=Bacillus swezeyi TaxID=1925020 RepID=A0A5M8RTZ4_9BACI|nr:hypothetical protein [Bacillus swezeyi]KAA6450713.1 hypothetical protein DX927_07615 [Bacillus swezeyi]KAA6475085.1 hypothetical protein DX928_13835 [Bacillus swezeyi]TYS37249.1 hypothetical protein FZC77_07460 [Bacillus swezeyi]
MDQNRGMFRLKKSPIQTLLEEEQARLPRIAERLKQAEKEGRFEKEFEVVSLGATDFTETNFRSLRTAECSIGEYINIFTSSGSFFGMVLKNVRMKLI